jgi:hypothetical protein
MPNFIGAFLAGSVSIFLLVPIFLLPRLRRKRLIGKNVCNALASGARGRMLCDHVPVNGTASKANKIVNERGRHGRG